MKSRACFGQPAGHGLRPKNSEALALEIQDD
jgi:hypothetical protein